MAGPVPNLAIRQVREVEFQMSRGEFAAEVNRRALELGERGVGCITRTVATWEEGTVGCPRPVYRRVLSAMTGRTMAQLGFQPPLSRTRPGPPIVASGDHEAGGEGQVERRRLLVGAGTLTAAAGLGIALPDLGSTDSGPGRLGVRHVKVVGTTTADLYAHDQDHGSAALRRDAAAALATAYSWIQQGSYSPATGRQLQSATGHLAVAAGWLCLDSGLHGDARSLYTEALAAARMADDAGLEAHAFACMSLLAHASGRPREAVSAAQVAQSVAAPLGSPRWLSLLAMREARGWALQGDQALTDKAVVRAHDLYGQGPGDGDPDWLAFFSPAELAGLESLCRADLGQHDRAAAGAESAVLLSGTGFTRNRALYTADIAVHQAVRDRPEPEAAAEAATRALAYLPEVRSGRLVRALGDVASALQRHRRVPAVSTWFNAYDHATTAL